MHVPVLLLCMLWSCCALSLVALAQLGYAIYEMDDWTQFAAYASGLLVVMALMTCSLVLLGHSTSALWAWRVLSAINFILSSIVFVAAVRAKQRGPAYGLELLLLSAATAVNIIFFVCSAIVRALPYVGASASVPFRVEPTASFLTQLSFWDAALYVILALASVICGVLFIASSRSDGPLSFERSGGGLGMGSGGWEVSNSLTYLIATIALSGLLLGLIFHKDTIEQEREQRQVDAVHKASPPADVTTSHALAAGNAETVKTVPATPAAQPAGAESNGH